MKKILLKSLSFFLITGTLCAADIGQEEEDEIVTSESDQEERYQEGDYEKSNFPLHIAIIHGENIAVIKEIINKRPEDINEFYDFTRDINYDNQVYRDMTPSLLAAEFGNLQALQALYAAGADLDLQEDSDDYSSTPLTRAIRLNHFDVVTWLLDQRDAQGNFVVNRRKEYKIDGIIEAPLYLVIDKLNIFFSVADQERSQLPDDNPDKYIPGCLSRDADGRFAIRGDIYPEASTLFQLLKKLIEEDPSIINIPDSTGKTPLFKAIEETFSPFLIDMLCALGADTNIPGPRGVTPLLLAIEKSTQHGISVVSGLLQRGALPDVMDDDGHNPLVEAVKKGLSNSVKYLLDAKADPNKADGLGTTPLIAAIQAPYRYIGQDFQPHQPSFDALLGSAVIPVDVNMSDYQGFTPLWYACDTEWAYGFRSLLCKGAIIDRDAYSKCLALKNPLLTSFLQAIQNNNPSFDFSMQDVSGDTALMHLLDAKNDYFTESLLNNNSKFRESVSIANLSGQTPLMIAAKQGSLNMLAKLVAYYGARVDQVDKCKKTVFGFMDDYIKAQNDEIAQMPNGPEKKEKIKKVKDFLDFKHHLPELPEEAKEINKFKDFQKAFDAADKVDDRVHGELLLAKEKALDFAHEVGQGLQLAKRQHLGEE